MHNIIENNLLIAIFEGFPIYNCGSTSWVEFSEDNTRSGTDLFYHNDWNWLMPVFRKIVDYCCNEDEDAFCSDVYTSILDIVPLANISDAYGCVVEFIDWFNNKEAGNG